MVGEVYFALQCCFRGKMCYVFQLIYSKNVWSSTFISPRLPVFLFHTGANFVTKKFGTQFKMLHLVNRGRKGRWEREKEGMKANYMADSYGVYVVQWIWWNLIDISQHIKIYFEWLANYIIYNFRFSFHEELLQGFFLCFHSLNTSLQLNLEN